MLGLVLAVAAAAPAAPPANPDPKHLAVAPADHARAKSLVEKLASPDYEDRQKAHAELADMGRLAVPALVEALARHPSAEVRSRCQALFPRARADDLEARLAAFAADEAGKFEHDVPGWDDFRTVAAGFEPAARAVFADLAATPLGRELVLGDLSPENLGARVAVRRQELYTHRFMTARRPNEVLPEPPVLDVLALMIAETRVPSRLVPRSAAGAALYAQPWILYQLGVIPDPTRVIDPPARVLLWNDRVRVYRAIAGKWAVTRDEPITMSQALEVAKALELPEAADLAARMLTTPGVAAVNKAPAALVVGKHGNPRHLPALEAAFKDEGVIPAARVVFIGGPGVPAAPPTPGTQLRDVALVAAVLMTGQEPRDYGFDEVGSPRGDRYQLGRWYLPTARRAAAFERWQAWRAEHPNQ